MADESRLEEPWFTNGDIRLHAVAAGPQDGPVVILLHGFPEFWYGWNNQIAPFADAGFRVIAPDQRTSSKPAGIPAYKVLQLTSDVIAIVDQSRQRSWAHPFLNAAINSLASYSPSLRRTTR